MGHRKRVVIPYNFLTDLLMKVQLICARGSANCPYLFGFGRIKVVGGGSDLLGT